MSAQIVSVNKNRHIVDELADVRERLKVLKATESALRDEISAEMGEADSLGGDEYIARQTITERAGALDTKAMEKAGIDVEKFRKPKSTVLTIRVERRAQEVL